MRKANLIRCSWVPNNDTLYEQHHDTFWGVPVFDDKTLFEYLVLEGAQAGLSWKSVLIRKKGYAEAFFNYDLSRIIALSDTAINQYMVNQNIIRNRKKIESVINNARQFIAIQEEYGTFSKYLWHWVDFVPVQHRAVSLSDIPAQDSLSVAISNDLRARGFSFVGPTIIYAYLQAVGVVNDHTLDCFRHNECVALVIKKEKTR